MRRVYSIVAIAALQLVQCDFASQVEERLNILAVQFQSEGVGVGIIAPVGGFPKQGAGAALSDWGIRFNWRIKGTNSSDKPAVFDGAGLALRISDTGPAADSIPGSLPGFRVAGDSALVCTASVPVTLDKWPMSYDVLKKVIAGDKIPYRLSASLLYKLVAPNLSGGSDTLGSGTVPLNLVTDSLSTRPDPNSVEVQALLQVLSTL